MENKKVENVYTFGSGKVSVGVGKLNDSETYFIDIAKLENPIKIGTDLMVKEVEQTERILLCFKNLEGFKVFEEMVKKVKIKLKEQKKILK